MPELSGDQQFQKVLAIAENQLKRKQIQVRFGPQGKMRFIIDEASLRPVLAESGVDDATFREIFHSEIGPLLEAIVRGVPEQYIENAPRFDEEPSKRAGRKEVLRKRSELVRQRLVDNGLRSRYLIKASSKHPRLRTCEWEVGQKVELPTKEVWLQPYATLSFETIRPEQSLGIFSLLPFFPSESVGRSEFCAFDCDEEDLDDLIQSLQEAKEALHKAGL